MKKLILCFCFISFSISAQDSVKKELDSIIDMDLAKEYINSKKSKSNKLITFNKEKHKTTLAKSLFELPIGRLKTTENEYGKVYYKVIDRNKVPHYRVSYIFFDGNKMSTSEIDRISNDVLVKYKNRVPFRNLAKYYSMDNTANRGGDLGWFSEGDMPEEFESKVINGAYNIGDIFMVRVLEKKWYYLVLKTHETKNISEIDVLKIVESRK